MPSRGTTTGLAGRQVDLELSRPVEDYRMGVLQTLRPAVEAGGRALSGVEKAAQRYARLFLTGMGSVKADPAVGSTVVARAMSGTVSNSAVLSHLCAVADANAVLAMAADDADSGTFGGMSPDERVASTRILSVSLVRDSSSPHAGVTVELVTEAGEGCTFVVPVSAGTST